VSATDTPGNGEGSDTRAVASLVGATTRTLTLKTAIGGQFVSAEHGGGGDVLANGPVASTWETFTLIDLNGGSLQDGDLVNLKTLDGHFVCAEGGGGPGSVVNATRTKALDWETFRVTKLYGTGAVNDGDQIDLQTKVAGTYVSALNGGGGGVVSDRRVASGWEAFFVGGGGGNGGGGGGQPSATTEYAPYFYTWGWGSSSYAFRSLVEMKAKGGPSAATIAFVLSNGGCAATRDIQGHLDDVHAFVAAGGHLKASFGGAAGTYLEYTCSSAGALASALVAFVDQTGIADLDFDLEQGSRSSNAALNGMRAAALKQAQDQRNIRVAFTLPVSPSGLEPESIAILRAAIDAGVRISFVNGMTMDYGSGTDLGTTPIRSIDSLAGQIRGLLPQLSLDQAYRMVGATPMIGRNDDGTTFTLDNARALINHASQKKIGLVSFWAIQRDEACPSSGDLGRCSLVNSATFQFHTIFAGVNHP
jgi:chitinase